MSNEAEFTGGFWWKGVWYSVGDNGWGSAGKPTKFKPRPPMPPAVLSKKEKKNAEAVV